MRLKRTWHAYALPYNEDVLDKLTLVTENLMYLVELIGILQEYTPAMTLFRAIKSQPNVDNFKSGDKTENQIFYYQNSREISMTSNVSVVPML